MDQRDVLRAYRDRHAAALAALDLDAVARFVALLEEARQHGRTVFAFGNGGSASTASHIACDLSKGVPPRDGASLRMLCLNDNVPMMMAYANDVSYADIFCEPLKMFLRPGDVVVALSGSGNSENVIRAVQHANDAGACTVGLCGYDGGRLLAVAGLPIHVPVPDMQVAEDLHLSIGHMAMQALGGGAACVVAPALRR